MLRAAFPCPPPTQLRERPNMLAANGCYGLRRALRLHSPAGKGGRGANGAPAGGDREGAPSAAVTGAHKSRGACAGGARREAPSRVPPRRRRADCKSQQAPGRGGAASSPQIPAFAGRGGAGRSLGMGLLPRGGGARRGSAPAMAHHWQGSGSGSVPGEPGVFPFPVRISTGRWNRVP